MGVQQSYFYAAFGLRVKILFTCILNSIQSYIPPMLPINNRVTLTTKGSGRL